MPLNDENFDEKVRDISELYITAPERAKQGERTLSTDEMTGVQALKRKALTYRLLRGRSRVVNLNISDMVLKRASFTSKEDPKTRLLEFVDYFNR
ncbi:MAG: hypothetical protein U9Q68_10205 [Euryarchaeota archaeon]|nr:hypothetical protein [Euryarchaeota archaeon]